MHTRALMAVNCTKTMPWALCALFGRSSSLCEWLACLWTNAAWQSECMRVCTWMNERAIRRPSDVWLGCVVYAGDCMGMCIGEWVNERRATELYCVYESVCIIEWLNEWWACSLWRLLALWFYLYECMGNECFVYFCLLFCMFVYYLHVYIFKCNF